MNSTTSPDGPLGQARSLLFVPGNRPERFSKAMASGADAVVLDLEDSVPLTAKAMARAAIAAAWSGLKASGRPVVIRINAPDGAEGVEDLVWLSELGAPDGLMVPKAESPDSLVRVLASAPDAALLPIIETAAGHAGVRGIAAATGVVRLAVGHIDFMADTGIQCGHDESELAPLRFAVAMATRLHGLAAAVDGVTVDIHDEDRLRTDTQRSLRFGFGGKLCIHPGQIAVVHAAMAPSADEEAWARRVIEADAAAGGAAVQLDGRMVDAPVVLQARRMLARLRRPQGQ